MLQRALQRVGSLSSRALRVQMALLLRTAPSVCVGLSHHHPLQLLTRTLSYGARSGANRARPVPTPKADAKIVELFRDGKKSEAFKEWNSLWVLPASSSEASAQASAANRLHAYSEVHAVLMRLASVHDRHLLPCLEDWLHRYRESSRPGASATQTVLRPDIKSFNIVMNALSRGERAAAEENLARCTRLLTAARMAGATPNSHSYTALLMLLSLLGRDRQIR
jgi:hypothetical protein